MSRKNCINVQDFSTFDLSAIISESDFDFFCIFLVMIFQKLFVRICQNFNMLLPIVYTCAWNELGAMDLIFLQFLEFFCEALVRKFLHFFKKSLKNIFLKKWKTPLLYLGSGHAYGYCFAPVKILE